MEELLLFGPQRSGQPSVVSLLIEKGAELNVRDNDGRSALILVSQEIETFFCCISSD